MQGTSSDRDVFIIGGKRTPIGSLGGSLASASAVALGTAAVQAALVATGVASHEVDECIFGCVLTSNLGQGPARQVALASGLPTTCRSTTVNKVCASGAKAVSLAAQSILLGHSDVVVAGGMESMSNAPYMIGDQVSKGSGSVSNRARNGGLRLHDAHLIDSIMRDGLTDSTANEEHSRAMGFFADECALRYRISREAQDAYAMESYGRARVAWDTGIMHQEVVKVQVGSGTRSTIVERDEEIDRLAVDKVSTLRPAFHRETGTATAANSSKISDGAAALVLVSRRKAIQLGILTDQKANRSNVFQLMTCADAEQEPQWFTTSPVLAIHKLFQPSSRTHSDTLSDVDCWEINEAFSVVPLAIMQEIPTIQSDRMNMHGGAVALGHPIGCSGARIIVTLMTVMEQNQFTTGVAAVCNGGGGATALYLKRVPFQSTT